MGSRLLLTVLCAASLAAQHSDTALTNPFRSPRDREQGGSFYRSQCAACHGVDGKGGAAGPSLASGSFRHASSDEAMFRVITRGIPGTSMPGFSMNGREIWQIVAFVRSLSTTRAGAGPAGDPAAGRALLTASRCLDCHSLRGEGAPHGLDLSSIGARLSPAELRLALTDPSAEVAPEYWPWQGTLQSGETIRGFRLNEDTFSLQIRDTAGRLRSVRKAALSNQSLERRSPMPSFTGKLTPAQLNDLTAYLATCTEDAK
jgi:cytochrome c oxidase cbb3-type subunit III